MLEIDIPGYRALRLQHLVLDYNGTLACDGVLLDGVRDRLLILAGTLHIHILTADTFGKARAQLVGVPCELSILPGEDQAQRKLEYVQGLDPKRRCAWAMDGTIGSCCRKLGWALPWCKPRVPPCKRSWLRMCSPLIS